MNGKNLKLIKMGLTAQEIIKNKNSETKKKDIRKAIAPIRLRHFKLNFSILDFIYSNSHLSSDYSLSNKLIG